MARVFFVRHGQASFTAADYDQLSPLGAEQSRLLGDWFSQCGWPVHHVAAGGLKRHLQTAEGFFEAYPGLPAWRERLLRLDGMNEFNHLDLFERWNTMNAPASGGKRVFGQMSDAEFDVLWPQAILRWAEGKNDDDYAEAWTVFSQRCFDAFQAVADLAQSGENAIIFTSGGPICAICQHILGLSAAQMVRLIWEIKNSSVTTLRRRDDGGFSITTINALAHLDRTGRAELLTMK